MTKFEYTTVTWPQSSDEGALLAALDELGGNGWEAVSMVTRGHDVPMAGMGAQIVPEVVVLLKRPRVESRAKA